ncbi:hypothetical protein PtA15_10A351 [Puccinia triticina]|uniref:Protein transport protein sec16 n=1 Tax=Puccinia triticina TaxID=208348 RepID=A0ABY7CUF1_9BASI|nr:uncharacterized protein PtA15_10A351 [Puccinia triticina]WAQ88928.1 hypothetical protein PtA15_10A351 [Puccinia triticina]
MPPKKTKELQRAKMARVSQKKKEHSVARAGRKKATQPSKAPREDVQVLTTAPVPQVIDPWDQARKILHVSSTPSWLPFREEEFAELEGALTESISELGGCCLYISGVETMSKSDADIKPQDIELPLSSPESAKLTRSRANRPPSIGDASQLFGGGSGSDDFFGPPSTFSNDLAQQGSLFDPVPEENGNTSSFDHDPFAWPTTDQPTIHSSTQHPSPVPNNSSQISDPNLSASYDPSSGFSSDYFNPYQPAPESTTYHQDHQPSNQQNIYSSPNLSFDPQGFNDPASFGSPASPYPQSVHHSSTGLGISHSSPQAPYGHQQQPDVDAYNPYAPAETHPVTQNRYSAYAPHQTPVFDPPNPHLADVIPRSASVNALSHSDAAQQASAYPNFQRPKLVQSATHHSSSPLNRPKVYDAYDPPAIRKKKTYAFNTTASLPSTPALGGDGFQSQIPLSGFNSSPQNYPTSFTPPPPPPPPPKQRCTSTPAHTHGPIQMSHMGSKDFYAQPPHILNPQRQFVSSVYSNHQQASSPLSKQPTFFESDPYQSHDYAPPSHEIISNPSADGQFQDFSRPSQEYQYGQPSQPPAQSTSTPYMPTSQVEDPYAPTPSSHPDQNRRNSIPLVSPPVTVDPSHPYAVGQGPPSHFGHVVSGIHIGKQKVGSPLKMSIVADVDENVDEQHQQTFSSYQGGDYSAQVQPQDPVDALSSATQRLSINSQTAGSDSLNPSAIRFDEDPVPQTPPISLDPTANAQLASSFNTPEKLMSVPDVQIQPATPQISAPGNSIARQSRQFDEAPADMTATTHNQPISGSKSMEAIPLDSFDYGAPNDSNSQYTDFQYGNEYSHEPAQNNPQGIHQLDYSQSANSNRTSEGSPTSYNPYSAPVDVHNPASPSTLNGYPSSQPADFAHSDPYNQSSDYNLMGEGSVYGSTNQQSQSIYGLQPEGFTPDHSTTSRDTAPTDWPLESAAEDQVKGPSVYNPYHPMGQSHPDHMSRQMDDPMSERLTARVPVASFGFGGKLITVFPANVGGRGPMNGGQATGYEDPYGSGGMFPTTGAADSGTTVRVQKLSEVIPSSDLQSFPGPLFMDGGNKSNLGKKRKDVVGWLEAKLDEAEKELVFIQSTLVARHLNQDQSKDAQVENLQDKIILVKLLKLLVENEGKLSGTSKIDEAVRLVLQSMDSQPATVEATSALSNLSPSDSNPQDIITTYHTRSSHLDSIQALLSNGDRQKAVQVSVEHRMWPHALIIANSLGNDVWRETVKEFVRFEMADGDLSALAHAPLGSAPPPPPSKGREGLRTLYTLFAGAGPAAVDEFSLSGAHTSPSHLESHAMSAMSTGINPSQMGTSRTPSPAPLLHPIRPSPAKIPNNVLHQWRSVVAMTISNRVPGSAPFLLRLGDTLLSNGRTYAAHTTYLLSNGLMPQVSLDNGNRISLLGSPAISNPERPGLDLEAVMLTEVLEFALSLSPVPKNVDQFIGIPHLQAYRLALGLEYATFGLVDRANKYCEALGATTKLATKPCPFYHASLLEQVKTLSGRLSATPLADKGSSWITRKMPRPTLDNVWQSLEGRVHKFVAGDDDETSNQVASTSASSAAQNNKVLGPFSHYSSISPGSVSGSVSRVQSSSDLGQINTQTTGGLAGPFHHNANLQRPSSGAGYSPSYYSKDPRRASPSNQYEGSSLSPVDYVPFRGQTSSVPPLNSYEQTGPSAGSPANPSSPGETVTGENAATTSSGGGWWEASNSYGTPANSTSQPVFESIQDTPIADDGSGFIDPMASFGGPVFGSPIPSMVASHNSFDPPSGSRTQFGDDDEEDLGFGNSSSRKRDNGIGSGFDDDHRADDSPSNHHKNDKNDSKPAETDSENKSIKNAPSSSWLGRWFKRDSGSQAPPGSGPVKANLGEDFSLVYDPETKRWVNKKAGATQSASTGGPPPPPPRAQTASPTSSMRPAELPPTTGSRNSPGPNRVFSAGVPPPPAMSRSNTTGLQNGRNSLDVPPASSSSVPAPPPSDHNPPAAAAGLANTPTPPPPSSIAGKKPNAKKNIRSRYVEIR